MARHLLDHASTSPLRPEAAETLARWNDPATRGELGDPSRLHAEGMRSRVALETARDQVAAMVGARSREIVFTSGSTESIAAATWGAVRRSVERGHRPHIALSAVEHSAVRLSSEQFAGALGGTVTTVGVAPTGRVDPDELLAAVNPTTSLVHLQWGNHEVGTLQPVAEVTARCQELGVLVHIDASHAVGQVPIDFSAIGADLLSFSGHRFGAPSGTGVLIVRRGLRLEPLLQGSDQERGRRAGLEPLIAILGLGAVAGVLDPLRLEREENQARVLIGAIANIAGTLDDMAVLGDPDPDHRLPHIACFAVGGVEPQAALLGLDQRGIAAHSGSACASEEIEPSPVLEAMGADAHRSLRFSVGWSSSKADVEALGRELGPIIQSLRQLAR